MVQQTLSIQLDAPSREYIAAVARPGNLFEKQALFAAILRVFARSSSRIASAISRNYLRGQSKSMRLGVLARSIVGDAELFDGVPSFRVGVLRGPALRYAGVQEEGTRDQNPDSPYPPIEPRDAKALAIPIGKGAVLPSGASRYESPRDYPGKLRFIPFRGARIAVGALYDEEDLKRRKLEDFDAADASHAHSKGLSLDNLRPAYLLVRRTSIKAGHFLRGGMDAGLPAVQTELAEFIASIIEGRTEVGFAAQPSVAPEGTT